MSGRKILKCFDCKESFRREELISYCPDTAKNPHWYCEKCLKEKQEREKFSNCVCVIFGIKSPGPRIWTERKRLQLTYGYTDQTILDCLDYIYNVENKKKFAESLCLVNPTTVAKMLQYKRMKENQANSIAQAAAMEIHEYIVPIRESKGRKKELLNPDDFLDD